MYDVESWRECQGLQGGDQTNPDDEVVRESFARTGAYVMGIPKSRRKRRRLNMPGLEGKVALVTGGSRGIGAAIARRLAREGADVALTYLNAAGRAKAVVEEIEASGRVGLAIPTDGAEPKAVVGAVEQTVNEFGRLDVLVNNAGIFPNGPHEDVSIEEVDRTLAVHVRAAFVASQVAAKHMEGGGRIISIGS